MVQVFYSEITDLIKPRHANRRKLVVRMDDTNGVVSLDNATKLYFELNEIEELISAYESGIYKRTMR